MKSDWSMDQPPKLSSGPPQSNSKPQTHRPVSPVPSGVSMKSDWSMDQPPKLSSGPPQSNSKPQTHRPVSPVPSGVSMKSDWSMDQPPKFSSGPPQSNSKPQTHRPVSPVPSGVSMKSDWSMDQPPKLCSGPPQSDPKPQTHRPVSPVPSGVSMKSDWSMDQPPKLSSGPPQSNSKPQTHRPVSPVPSCVSMKSDWSMDQPPKLSSGPPQSDPKPQTHRPVSPLPSCVSMKSDWSMDQAPKLSSGPPQSNSKPQAHRPVYPVPSSVSMKSDWSMDQPPKFSSGPPQSNSKKGKNELLQNQPQVGERDLTQFLKVSYSYREQLCHIVQKDDEELHEAIRGHKAAMKKRFQEVNEGQIEGKEKVLLNTIYTELYISEVQSEGVNREHEVQQIAKLYKIQNYDSPINCNDIFKFSNGEETIKTVMTKGVAGIGKTVSVQKFILDWADGLANQAIDFIFVLPFREINLVKHEEYNLIGLLKAVHPQLEISCIPEHHKVLFIFDGLDESRLEVRISDQQPEETIDVTTNLPVAKLIESLIQGNLLPSALIWITSRPAAANQIPAKYISQMTEIRGFNDEQKEEYFKRRIQNPEQANSIISHIRTSKSLFIMCHIPVFCWISATVLQHLILQDDKEIPKTMTEMFSHFLLILTDVQHQKYLPEHKSTQEDQNIPVNTSKKVINKLAELAFKQLMNGNILFYEEDLKECGINVREASVYSGICTEIFKEELVIRQKRVFSFVHLSIQEFLAAFFAFHSFANIKKDSAEDEVEESEESSEEEESPEEESLSEDDFDLMSIDGEIPGDYFTSEDESMTDSEERPRNKDVLRELLEDLHYKEDELFGNEETFKDEDSFDEEEQPEVEDERQENGNIHGTALDEEKSEDGNMPENLVDVPWSQETPVYDGNEGTSCGEEIILRVNLDVLKVFPVVGRQLHHLLKSAVKKSLNSKMGHLDLFLRFLLGISLESNQKLLEDLLRYTISSSESTEKTLQYIKKILKKRHDSPERCLNLLLCLLEMKDCSLHQEVDQYVKSGQRLSPEQCSTLAYILLASEDVQEEFDLTKYNTTVKSRERLLTAVKGCKKARLSGCVFFNNFGSVTSALESKTSFLRELDLSYCLVDGVPELFQGLAHKNCKVETLRLVRCQITKKTCEGLASIQKSKHSCLKDLDISCNDLRDSGVKKLSQWLTHRNCKLERLRLASCGLASKSCAIISSVLQSGNSSLSELDLSFNNLVSGVIHLFQGLEHQHCKLTSFCLAYCGITVESCTALASALQSEHSQLQELDLSDNDLTDSGVEALAVALSQSKLEILRLSGCRISEVGCKCLASAQYSTLKELDLSYNHTGDKGIDLLQICNLKTLNLEHNGPKMLQADFKKYACELTLDPNTVHPQLALSEDNRKVDIVKKKQPYPDHPERFQDIPHVMCAEGLTGRCYWEVDWSLIKSSKCRISETARGAIGVAYKSFTRKGSTLGCMLGINNMSWSLVFAGDEESDVTSFYNSKAVYVGSNRCERVGVYLDWPAGILSFYTVSSGEHTHLHTIFDKFTEPLYPAFMFMLPYFSITLVGPS